MSTYGWQTLQSQQWTVLLKLLLDFSKLTNVLKISGKLGVFIEHLAQNRSGDVIIDRIPQERDEDDIVSEE